MYNLLFCINSKYIQLFKICLSSIVRHSGFDSMNVNIIHSSLKDSEIEENQDHRPAGGMGYPCKGSITS